MLTITSLVDAALQLGDPNITAREGRLWQAEGGRCCPIGWEDCSQAVYVDVASGEYDYGEHGGPGAADCERHCPHGHQPASEAGHG